MKNTEYLINAAGGNATAIQVIKKPESAKWYATHGKALNDKYESLGSEQAGFVVLQTNQMEMMGGEFCGNATRAAAVVLAEITGQKKITHGISGFSGSVISTIKKKSKNLYDVTSIFANMSVPVKKIQILGKTASLVDLDGIVHVVIEGKFPESDYKLKHRQVVKDGNLASKNAVGVIWYQRDGDTVHIDPVVWVREVDTFYYETACGSGSLAASRVTGVHKINQVSGQNIYVEFTDDQTILKSEMEVIYRENNLLRPHSPVSTLGQCQS